MEFGGVACPLWTNAHTWADICPPPPPHPQIKFLPFPRSRPCPHPRQLPRMGARAGTGKWEEFYLGVRGRGWANVCPGVCIGPQWTCHTPEFQIYPPPHGRSWKSQIESYWGICGGGLSPPLLKRATGGWGSSRATHSCLAAGVRVWAEVRGIRGSCRGCRGIRGSHRGCPPSADARPRRGGIRGDYRGCRGIRGSYRGCRAPPPRRGPLRQDNCVLPWNFPTPP